MQQGKVGQTPKQWGCKVWTDKGNSQLRAKGQTFPELGHSWVPSSPSTCGVLLSSQLKHHLVFT